MNTLKRFGLVDCDGMTFRAICLILLAFFLMFGVALHFAYQHDKAACEAAGGTLDSDTSTGVGTVITNGKVGTGMVTTTDIDCVMP